MYIYKYSDVGIGELEGYLAKQYVPVRFQIFESNRNHTYIYKALAVRGTINYQRNSVAGLSGYKERNSKRTSSIIA